MAYAAPIGEHTIPRRSVLRRLATGVTTLVGMSACVGTLLVLLADAVSEDGPRRAAGSPEPSTISLAYGGQLDRPDPGDLIEPAGLMGLGLLGLGLANGLIFAFAAALDGVRGPSAAETRRRLRNRRGRGAVPGGRREVARTVRVPAAAPAASSDPAAVIEADELPARRSAPGRAAVGTTYAPIPALRAPAPAPTSGSVDDPDEHVAAGPPAAGHTTGYAPRRGAEHASVDGIAAEATGAPGSTPSPPPELVPEPRAPRPSPTPRDGGDGPRRHPPSLRSPPPPATCHGTGPWGWRPARPDPVPWRNPTPWPALAGAH